MKHFKNPKILEVDIDYQTTGAGYVVFDEIHEVGNYFFDFFKEDLEAFNKILSKEIDTYISPVPIGEMGCLLINKLPNDTFYIIYVDMSNDLDIGIILDYPNFKLLVEKINSINKSELASIKDWIDVCEN